MTTPPGITWQPEHGTTDRAHLHYLPAELREIIVPTGGFILHHGALHFRGCVLEPEWHSLRAVRTIASLYPGADADDIAFAQDQLGDQYLLRGETVMHLCAETGAVRRLARCLTEFMDGIGSDLEDYLNLDLRHRLQPGQLLMATPPFSLQGTQGETTLKSVPAMELLHLHADLARQFSRLP